MDAKKKDKDSLSSLYHDVKMAMLASMPPPPQCDDGDEDLEEGTPADGPSKNDSQPLQRLHRIQVNHRALIDKILARCASAKVVYRELLTNSNDAGATKAQIHFFLKDDENGRNNNSSQIISQVIYRNNGMTFRPEDWERLQTIAEGNPDPDKIGVLGVGAYTMFSSCEEPIIVSGERALWFRWRGNSLWTQEVDMSADSNVVASGVEDDDEWTSFLLPMRNAECLTNASLLELGSLLCSSLAFAHSITSVEVFVNGKRSILLSKSPVQNRTPLAIPSSHDGYAIGSDTTHGVLQLDLSTLQRQTLQLSVEFLGQSAAVTADHISASANTHFDAGMAQEIMRITKKDAPGTVRLQILRPTTTRPDSQNRASNKAARIARNFVHTGNQGGKVFFGFHRTSQTTGFSSHVCAPFLPTIEREGIDLQHHSVSQFNFDLLECSGMVLRVFFEAAMEEVGILFKKEQDEATEMDELAKELLDDDISFTEDAELSNKDLSESSTAPVVAANSSGFLASTIFNGVTDGLAAIVLIGPPDDAVNEGTHRAHSSAVTSNIIAESERQSILLMKSFCAKESTPECLVGGRINDGFIKLLSRKRLPVITCQGLTIAKRAKLPHEGFENFCSTLVVRTVVANNAADYLTKTAYCRLLSENDLINDAQKTIYSVQHLIALLNWYQQYHHRGSPCLGEILRENFHFWPSEDAPKNNRSATLLKHICYYLDNLTWYYLDPSLPLPDNVIPRRVQEEVGLLGNSTLVGPLSAWFKPFTIFDWVVFISTHPAFVNTDESSVDLWTRAMTMLSAIHLLFRQQSQLNPDDFEKHCRSHLSLKRCIPYDLVTKEGRIIRDAGIAVPSAVLLDDRAKKSGRTLRPKTDLKIVAKKLSRSAGSLLFLKSLPIQTKVSVKGTILLQRNQRGNSLDSRDIVSYFQRQVKMSEDEREHLRFTPFLYAVNDSRQYLASDLCFPDDSLRMFPSVKILDWPSAEKIDEFSKEGSFLHSLGVQTHPPIQMLIQDVPNSASTHVQCLCLRYIAKLIRESGGVRRRSWSSFKFLPCKVRSPFAKEDEERIVLHSPEESFLHPEYAVLGFPILICPEVGKVFGCARTPIIENVTDYFLAAVDTATRLVSQRASFKLLSEFNEILKLMDKLTEQMDSRTFDQLRDSKIIPYKTFDGRIAWTRPELSLFYKAGRDKATRRIFPQIKFEGKNFLLKIGVREEPGASDWCHLLLAWSPAAVLKTLGSYSLYISILLRASEDEDILLKASTKLKRKEAFVGVTTDERRHKENNLPVGETLRYRCGR